MRAKPWRRRLLVQVAGTLLVRLVDQLAEGSDPQADTRKGIGEARSQRYSDHRFPWPILAK
jgi:hypothetical protein